MTSICFSRRIDKSSFAQKSRKQYRFLDNMRFLTMLSLYMSLVRLMGYAPRLRSQSISRQSRNHGDNRADGMHQARCFSPIKDSTNLQLLVLTSKLVGCCGTSIPNLSHQNFVHPLYLNRLFLT